MRPDVKKWDVHVVVNDWEHPVRFVGEAKCYDHSGGLLWTIPALCKGVEGNGRWTVRSGDTPPGLYLAGVVTETMIGEPGQVWNAYGRWFIDLVEQEQQEARVSRAGIGWHGGGTAAPDPLAPKQLLVPTLGCIRSHNEDLDKVVMPTLQRVRSNGGQMWITVNQF